MHLTDDELNEYLDNESMDRAQIESHISSCDECAARLSALQNLFTEIESLPELALTKSLSEASLWGVAPFTLRPSLPAQLPRWLPLTVTLQAVIAVIAFVVAAPFVIQLLPAIEMPSLENILIQLQSQWTTWLNMLSQFHIPTIPTLSFELSSIYLVSTLAVVSMLWLVGNGLLLRNQIKVEAGSSRSNNDKEENSMTDILRYFFIILLLTVSLAAYFLVIGTLFANRVAKTQHVISQMPGRAFGVGLVNFLFFGVILIILFTITDGNANRVSSVVRIILLIPTLTLTVLLTIVLSFGLAGIVNLLGEKSFLNLIH